MASLPPGFTLLLDVLPVAQADAAAVRLAERLAWQVHTFTIFGRTTEMPRRIAMYGPHGYAYSGVDHPPQPLPPDLEELRRRVEAATGHRFNSVLCNLYRTGRDSMGWHADADYDCGDHPQIASLSLGGVRRFTGRRRDPALRRSPQGRFSLDLPSGSVLVMGAGTQQAWQHALPRTARPVAPRVNLTFRWMARPNR